MLNDDEGWYSDTFLASAGKTCDYTDIYFRLGEVRFLVHLYHAQHRGDLNFEEYQFVNQYPSRRTCLMLIKKDGSFDVTEKLHKFLVSEYCAYLTINMCYNVQYVDSIV